MGFGAIAGGLGGMVGKAFGGEAASDSAMAGAANNAYIQDLNTEFQTNLFNNNQALSQPYLDYGYQGVQGLGQGGDYNFQGTPEYAYRQGLGNQAFAGMEGVSPDVLQFAQQQFGQNMDLQEQDNAYNRLLDAAYVGQGQAGQAGGQAQQYGAALANAYQNAGNMNLAGQSAYNQGMNNTMNTALGQASSIPAYMKFSNYTSGLGQPQQTANPNVYGGSMTNGGGFQNTPSYLLR